MLLFKDSPEQTREPAPDHEAPTSEKELKDFVEDAKKRDGVFHLDKSLSIEQLETKLGELEGLIEEFEKEVEKSFPKSSFIIISSLSKKNISNLKDKLWAKLNQDD